MATTSFTLRKTTAGFGSYLQSGTTDTALRSDQYIGLPEAEAAETNFFSANIIDSTKITLSWELSFLFSASAGAVSTPTALMIVASTTGEPITVQDGIQIFNTSRNDITTTNDIIRASEGRWVYYSLFIQYSLNDGRSWFQKVASLYIQVPISYGSVDNLWNRIPEYYRVLDSEQEGNPLYNFLELFGWELDRTRTLIETIPLSLDPEIAVTPALSALAVQMGLETNVSILGTTKVRSLMNNIGYIRRRKGTLESISYYLSALTGCAITYETTGSGASASYKFKVHSGRINFAADPIFLGAVSTTTTGTGATYRTSITRSSTWGVYSYGETSTTGASVTTTGSKLTVSNVGTGSIEVLIYQRNPFPYYQASNLYTGFVGNGSASASFNNFHISTFAKMGQWESTVGSGSVPSPLFYDTWNTTKSKLPEDDFHPEEQRYSILSNSLDTTTVSVVPVLHYTLPAGTTITLQNWLVEPFTIGSYFDGDTREGGFLPSTSGVGVGTSDYRWAGTRAQSFTYYMLDYQRTFSVVSDIIVNYIAPVTIKDQLTIEWNYYYGKL